MVRIVLGPIAVTIFNTVRTLVRSVNHANAMVMSTLIPDLQFELGVGNLAKARKIFRLGLSIISAISILGILFLHFGGTWIYHTWTNTTIIIPSLMWNIFILGIFFNGIWWMSSEVLNAANQPYQFTLIALFVSVLALLISYFLSLFFGLSGAAIGGLFLDILLFSCLIFMSCKHLEQPINLLLFDCFSDFKQIVIKSRILKIN